MSSAAACFVNNVDPFFESDYGLCVSRIPNLGILFVGSCALCITAVSWLSMVALPGKRDHASNLHRNLASAAQRISDFYFRLADLIVALCIFGMLVLLALFPLAKIQSILLFNRNFWLVTNRTARRADVMEKVIS